MLWQLYPYWLVVITSSYGCCHWKTFEKKNVHDNWMGKYMEEKLLVRARGLECIIMTWYKFVWLKTLKCEFRTLEIGEFQNLYIVHILFGNKWWLLSNFNSKTLFCVKCEMFTKLNPDPCYIKEKPIKVTMIVHALLGCWCWNRFLEFCFLCFSCCLDWFHVTPWCMHVISYVWM